MWSYTDCTFEIELGGGVILRLVWEIRMWPHCTNFINPSGTMHTGKNTTYRSHTNTMWQKGKRYLTQHNWILFKKYCWSQQINREVKNVTTLCIISVFKILDVLHKGGCSVLYNAVIFKGILTMICRLFLSSANVLYKEQIKGKVTRLNKTSWLRITTQSGEKLKLRGSWSLCWSGAILSASHLMVVKHNKQSKILYRIYSLLMNTITVSSFYKSDRNLAEIRFCSLEERHDCLVYSFL